jgi:hypothetical protein
MIRVVFALGKLLTILSSVLGLGVFVEIPVGIGLQNFPHWWFWPSSFVSITALCTAGILLAGIADGKIAEGRAEESGERRTQS